MTAGYTFPTPYRALRIDYIFASPTFAQRLYACEISYAIEKRKEIVQRWIKFRERFGGSSLRYFFLEENVSKSNMNEAIISLLIHYVDKMYGIYFVSLQTIFNDITVEGMSIRPDLFIFTPFNLDFKVIVECDGYDYHSNRHKFSDDRKRDRYLIREGFKVLRFSGTEINKQTLQSTQELYDYLVKQKDE